MNEPTSALYIAARVSRAALAALKDQYRCSQKTVLLDKAMDNCCKVLSSSAGGFQVDTTPKKCRVQNSHHHVQTNTIFVPTAKHKRLTTALGICKRPYDCGTYCHTCSAVLTSVSLESAAKDPHKTDAAKDQLKMDAATKLYRRLSTQQCSSQCARKLYCSFHEFIQSITAFRKAVQEIRSAAYEHTRNKSASRRQYKSNKDRTRDRSGKRIKQHQEYDRRRDQTSSRRLQHQEYDQRRDQTSSRKLDHCVRTATWRAANGAQTVDPSNVGDILIQYYNGSIAQRADNSTPENLAAIQKQIDESATVSRETVERCTAAYCASRDQPMRVCAACGIRNAAVGYVCRALEDFPAWLQISGGGVRYLQGLGTVRLLSKEGKSRAKLLDMVGGYPRTLQCILQLDPANIPLPETPTWHRLLPTRPTTLHCDCASPLRLPGRSFSAFFHCAAHL